MKKMLMDIICCPVCKGDLELKVNVEEGGEIIEGSLYCKKCDYHYPIEDSIPNLLPPELAEDYKKRSRSGGRKKRAK